MKKERLFYLDFVRAIAIIFVLISHFNAFLIDNSITGYKILFFQFPNGYIGKIGVSLFLIVSGAALMHTYHEHFNIKGFIKHRFLAIYPIYWIAYVIGFIYFQLKGVSMNPNTPKINFIYTIIGMDGYLSWKVPTFYILGEWFLGFIILLYFCFPILRKLIIKNENILLISTIVLYILGIQLYNSKMTIDLYLLARLPEFVFGMYFIRKIKNVNFHQFIISLSVFIFMFLIKVDLQQMYKTTIEGISLFITLAYVSQNIKVIRESWISIVKKPWEIVSKYSFAICLTHHVIISQVLQSYPNTTITRVTTYILFTIICIITALASFLVYKFDKLIRNIFRTYNKPLDIAA